MRPGARVPSASGHRLSEQADLPDQWRYDSADRMGFNGIQWVTLCGMTKTQVSVRYDHDVLASLERIAALRRVDRADVLREAASEYAHRYAPVETSKGYPPSVDAQREEVMRRLYDVRRLWNAPSTRPDARETAIMVNWLAGLLVDVELLARAVEPCIASHSEPGSDAAQAIRNVITELDVLSRPMWNAARALDATVPRPYTELFEPATITVSTRTTDNGEWRELRRHPGVDDAFDVVASAAFLVRAADYGIEPGTTVRVAVLDDDGQVADAFTCAAE